MIRVALPWWGNPLFLFQEAIDCPVPGHRDGPLDAQGFTRKNNAKISNEPEKLTKNACLCQQDE